MAGFPTRVTWSMLMALGVPVGAFASAYSAEEFRWKLPPGWSLVELFAGGLLNGPATGYALAELIVTGASSLDLAAFDPRRLRAARVSPGG